MGIFDNHKHNWSKWKETKREDLLKTNRQRVGYFLLQERECKTCGKKEFDKQQVRI